MYVHVYICIHIYLHICICIYIHIYIYFYIYMHCPCAPWSWCSHPFCCVLGAAPGDTARSNPEYYAKLNATLATSIKFVAVDLGPRDSPNVRALSVPRCCVQRVPPFPRLHLRALHA